MMGQSAHRGDRAASPRARSGPSLVDVVLGPLLYEFHDFHDQISFCCRGVPSPYLFPIYLYAQHVETNTYTKEIESR